MPINLPIEPAVLCHFNSNPMRNHFKQPNYPALSDQIGLDTSKKIIGTSSKLFTNTTAVLFNAIELDNKKDYTVSYYRYETSIPNNLNGNGNSTMLEALGFAALFTDNSNNYCLELMKSANPWSAYAELAGLWPASSDLNKWVHIEFSFQLSTKIFRIFRNGIIMASFTFPDLNGYYSSNVWIKEIGNIQELLAIQYCLHTANFTPPTEPYVWIDKPDVIRDNASNKLHGYI